MNEVGAVRLKVLRFPRRELKFAFPEELISATLKVAELWDSFTEREQVKQYLYYVKKVVKAARKFFLSDERGIYFLRVLRFIIELEFVVEEKGLYFTGAKFEKRKADELPREAEVSDLAGWLWKGLLFFLEEDGVSKEEFLNFLRNFEDEGFLSVLRKDFEEFTKKLSKKSTKTQKSYPRRHHDGESQ